MSTLCGHEREALIWACTEPSELSRELIKYAYHNEAACIAASRDVNNPAKLAELIAAELVHRGVKAEACEPFVMFREQPWPMVQVEDPVYMHKLVSADMKTSRARLLRLLRLPAWTLVDDVLKTMEER